MFCNHCGQIVSDGAQFCPACGTRVAGGAARKPSLLLWWVLGGLAMGLAVGGVLIVLTGARAGQRTPATPAATPPPVQTTAPEKPAAPAVTKKSLEADLRKRFSGKDADGTYVVLSTDVHDYQRRSYGVVIYGLEASDAFTNLLRYRPERRDWEQAVYREVTDGGMTFEQVDIPRTAKAWGVPQQTITDWIRSAEVAEFGSSRTAPTPVSLKPKVTRGKVGESPTELARRAFPDATSIIDDPDYKQESPGVDLILIVTLPQGTRLNVYMGYLNDRRGVNPALEKDSYYLIYQVKEITED